MQAYLEGLERRAEMGKAIDGIASVASFFVSRIDTNVDNRLNKLIERDPAMVDQAGELRGKIAIANARLAYQVHKRFFQQDRFQVMESKGARIQRPLWASTSTKNPEYRDTRYVDELIGPGTVNTIPPKTLAAFRDHGLSGLTLEKDTDLARQAMTACAALGVSMVEVTAELEAQGVEAFAKSYSELLESVERRRMEVIG
jgi:transaldolase